MNDIEVFHFEQERPNFESFGKDQEGTRYWLASELMAMLGYETIAPIRNAINKATQVCLATGIPIVDNFKQVTGSTGREDWQLSRTACYLTVMNGDIRNPRVASAQAYFVLLADTLQEYAQNADSVERILVRGEVTAREKTLSGVAHRHGVQNYQFFQNAGYRGMYNRNLGEIRMLKGIATGTSLLDVMGKTELAAHLFRITQTEEKIKVDNVRGQRNLEATAESVGRKVRATMLEISGTAPEALPVDVNINTVKRGIKATHRGLAKIDKSQAKTKKAKPKA